MPVDGSDVKASKAARSDALCGGPTPVHLAAGELTLKLPPAGTHRRRPRAWRLRGNFAANERRLPRLASGR
jgi:hypothetical protein